VRLEHLFSELLIAAILHCVHLKPVRVCVHVMVLGEEVADWVESSNNESNHAYDNLCIGSLRCSYKLEVFGDIMSHLRCRGRHSVFILDHSIVQLWWHGYDHMVKVRVEISSLWHIMPKWRCIVITSKQVVGVVDETARMGSDLAQFWWPHSIICSFCLMNCKIGSPHSIVDLSLPVVPLLEVVSFVLLMGWMNSWREYHFVHEFSLLEALINEEIVFLVHSSVTALARSLEYLKSSS